MYNNVPKVLKLQEEVLRLQNSKIKCVGEAGYPTSLIT